MTQEQEKLFSLFQEVHEICMKHHIVYYMGGGTLLGTLRHQGFIPWDDDLDLMMTRDEWQRFIHVMSREAPANRVLDCQELNRDYNNMIGRYMDTQTAAIHKNQVLGDEIAGYMIEIFVLDPVPDEAAYEQYLEDLLLYSDLINPTFNYSYRYGINRERYQESFAKMQKYGRDSVLSKLEHQMFRYREKDCPYYGLRWGGASFLFEKRMFGSSRWGMFEGVKCRIPDRSSDYLVQHYGDDWTHMPAHEDEETHDAIFSLTTDSRTIFRDYQRYLDLDEMQDGLLQRKNLFFEQMEERRKVNTDTARLIGLGAQLDFAARKAVCAFDPADALREGAYEKLRTLYGPYFEIQLSRRLIGRIDFSGMARFNNPVCVEIPERDFCIGVMLLLQTNQLAKAERLMDVWGFSGKKLPEDLLSARTLIHDFREAVSAYDVGEKEQAYQTAAALYEQWPQNESVLMFYVLSLTEQEKYEEANKVLTASRALFPHNGVLDKLAGDCCRKQHPDQAKELYDLAASKTNNGYILRQISEIRQNDPEMRDE